jgi:hypothetical protein
MKKISILFIACFLILSSCSSNDDETKVSENIIGTWIATNLSLSGEIITVIEGQTITSTLVGEGYDLTNRLIFSESPNLVESEGKLNMTLSYTINDITLSEDIEDFEFLTDGIWEIKGSELIITSPEEDIDDDEVREVKIAKLTDNELVIKITEDEEEIENGETITSSIEVLVSFVRQ